MSEQGSSGEASGSAAAERVATRARERHARDKGLVDAARSGDRAAFGKLYDEWVDSVYDRAVHAGASAAEAREITEQTFLAVWGDLPKLKQPAAFGAKVLRVARRETTARVSGGEKIVPKSGPSAEDRLTRATSAGDTAADPEAAAVVREAAHALDEQTRDILDLHFRLGLTKNEVAAVLGEQPDKVAQTITKLPPALAVLTRARVLWRGGSPEDDGLRTVLADEGITTFNASAVRTINRYAKDNDRSRARSLMGIPPVELFAAIPLADAPAGLKTAVASHLVSESVPMDGSAFVKRDDKGEIVDAPKSPPAPGGSVRPGIENKGPSIDPKKAAVVAAAALAAERAADDRTAADAAEAAASDANSGRSRRDRKANKADRAERAEAADTAAASAAADADEPDSPATDLAARKDDRSAGSGAAIAGAAAGAAGAAGASTLAGPVGASATEGGSGAADASEPSSSDPSSSSSDDAAAEASPAKGSSSTKGAVAAGAVGAGAADRAAAASDSEPSSTTSAAGSKPGARAGEQYVKDSGPGKWIAIGVAAAVIVGLVVFAATRGGDDDQQLATAGTPGTTASTTTTAPSSTTSRPTQVSTTFAPTPSTEPEPTATTTAPETPVTTAGGGDGGGGGPTPPPPPVTTTIVPVGIEFGISPNNVVSGYDPNAPDSPKLSWRVDGEATVTVEGPGFSSTLPAANSQSVCPVPLTDGRCAVSALPGFFAYRITVVQPGVAIPQVRQVVLSIRE